MKVGFKACWEKVEHLEYVFRMACCKNYLTSVNLTSGPITPVATGDAVVILVRYIQI